MLIFLLIFLTTSCAFAQDIPFPGPVDSTEEPGIVEWCSGCTPGPKYLSIGRKGSTLSDCSSYGNGGKITTNADGDLICADDAAGTMVAPTPTPTVSPTPTLSATPTATTTPTVQPTGIALVSDSGSGNVNLGGTLRVQGDTSGVDCTVGSSTFTCSFDSTEVGTKTFGSGSNFTWSFNDAAGSNSTFGLDAGDLIWTPVNDNIFNKSAVFSIDAGGSWRIEDSGGTKLISYSETTGIFQAALGASILANDLTCSGCVSTTEVGAGFGLLTGGVYTGNINMNDGAGDSPAISFIPSSGASFSLYGATGNVFYLETNSISDTTFLLSNVGAGDFELFADTVTADQLVANVGASFASLTIYQGQVNLTADNQTISSATLLADSYLDLSSNDAAAANRTIVLGNGTTAGQTLILSLVSNGNQAELADSGNAALSATWTATANDTISLIWNGTVWLETARSSN